MDGLIIEATEAMKRPSPSERFTALNRLYVDVGFQERREPRRALLLRAALLDLMVEALQSFARREPELAVALTRTSVELERARAEMEGDANFEEEVEVLRSALRP